MQSITGVPPMSDSYEDIFAVIRRGSPTKLENLKFFFSTANTLHCPILHAV
jgi:hypothetical protein